MGERSFGMAQEGFGQGTRHRSVFRRARRKPSHWSVRYRLAQRFPRQTAVRFFVYGLRTRGTLLTQLDAEGSRPFAPSLDAHGFLPAD